MDHNSKITIIGAGVFGLSTARQLASEGFRNITVVDRNMPPVPDGSSVDISRVIRFDYADDVYLDIAYEAYRKWSELPKYQGIFFPTSYVLTAGQKPASQSYIKGVMQRLNKRRLPCTQLESAASIRDTYPLITGEFAEPDTITYHHQKAGWAYASKAIEQLRDECLDLGVSFVVGPAGTIVGLDVDAGKSIKSAKTLAGTSIESDVFVLAAGAWASSLVPMYGSTLSTAQAIGYIHLTDSEMQKYAKLPISLNLSNGWYIFPPHEQSKTLKMAVHGWGYTRNPTKEEKATVRSDSSAPPLKPYRKRPNFAPPDAESRLREGLRTLLPELADRPFEKLALCWYTDTPTGDFIMDFHPNYSNLLVIGGGSGHAFKFLPVLGTYTTLALKRELPAHLAEKWKFQTKYERSETAFKGDGSRGGPERRELHEQEKARL